MAENGDFQFQGFRMRQDAQELSRNGDEVHLAKRPFQVLNFLIQNRDRIVERRELLDRFWDGHDVYDDALRKCVGSIRTALGDTKRPARFIETRYGSGYRFIAPLENGHAPLRSDKRHDQGWLSDLANRRVFLVALAVILAAFIGMGPYLAVSVGLVTGPAPETVSGVRSIAVLPLKNLTANPENDYICEGLTESILNDLSRIDGLRTVGSGSTSALSYRHEDPREIGRLLGVDALLQGSIQSHGDLVGLSVRLVSAADGSVLWTAPDIQRPTDKTQDLQGTVARFVAIALKSRINDGQASRSTAVGEAYEAYLKGRFFWNKRTGDGIKKSIELYEHATALDPEFALAYAGLAESYVQGIWHVPFDPADALARAKSAAERCIAINASLPEGYVALANVTALAWKWHEADQQLQTAIRLDPRFARAYHTRAFVLLILGRNDEAIESIEMARSLDPLSLVISTDKAMILFASHRDDEAIRQWRTTIELDPNFVLAHEHLAMAYGVLGHESAAIDEMLRAMELRGSTNDDISRFRTLASGGLRAIHRRNLDDMLAAESRGEKISSVQIAARYLMLGERNKAIDWVERAFNEHAADLVIARTSREFDALWAEPRITEVFRGSGMVE
ncbi:MAG: winged helix-turn-helix domain-containing protein [Chloracidobacterium sp.]|nr:winged helix-turn-helix domain-containing protein [Chloracidobacterium sp.]